MATIVHRLEEGDWQRLREMHEGEFLHGKCFIFARALHQGLGWPLVGLFIRETIAERIGSTSSTGWVESIVHCGVRTPKGLIFDIRGFLSEDEFAKLYVKPHVKPPYDIREISENDLKGSGTSSVATYEIQRARRIAEALWPELPWLGETRTSKDIAFANELEALCRKHNKWIRIPLELYAPQLQEGDGSEGGYTLRQMISGFGHTINCRIGS